MLKELRQHYDQLEAGRLALVKRVRELPPKMVNLKPGQDHWSILEDVQHLVLAEQRAALGVGAIQDTGAKNPDMLKMVLQVLDQDVAVDVPDPAILPDGKVELEDLIEDWEQARKRLHDFLETCGPEDLETPVSSHPVTGPLTVVDFLRLIDSHFNHHRRRIEAAVKDN
ncbi:MAG: DinB family protein [Desulfobacterales bacterium]|jgi:hypothetical protein